MEPPRLNIAIVGAGIAGALAARVLREQHDVCIYERARCATELGAAINIGPNAVKLLETLGFDRARVGSLAAHRMRTYNHKGDLLQDALRDFKQEFGADWLFQHRADLHHEFLRLATDDRDPAILGSPARIKYQTDVVRADPESATLLLADGTEERYDMVIGESYLI
jgi:salicylate hydroxylase